MFTQNGDVFAPTPGRDALLNELPVGNYIVIETLAGLMFKRVAAFPASGKMYGDVHKRAERILNTFLDRPRSTGVLLSGEKGSGKSQLARVVSEEGYKQGIPTILVNAPFHGDAFNALLGTIEQPAIILMDEFEKVYNQTELQEQVLTLLDGVMTSQKLFVLTVNDKYRVNEHMKNRPGRIYYSLEFTGLTPEFIREYCEDNLKDVSQTDDILKVSGMFQAFNFDMLKAMVEEINRYGESAHDVIEVLNTKPFNTSTSREYEVLVKTPDGAISLPSTHSLPMEDPRGHAAFWANFQRPKREKGVAKEKHNKQVREFLDKIGVDPDDFEDWEDPRLLVQVKTEHLVRMDVETGRYEFEIPEGNEHGGGCIVSYKLKVSSPYDIRHIDAY